MFNQFTAHIAIGSASTLLLLRTIAVWNRTPLVTAPLIVASLGQWCVLLIAIVTTRSSSSDIANAYVVEEVPPVFFELIYLYSEYSKVFSLVLPVVWPKQDAKYQFSYVVRPDFVGGHYSWAERVLQPVFALATCFPTRNHLLSHCIHRQPGAYHLPHTQPPPYVFLLSA